MMLPKPKLPKNLTYTALIDSVSIVISYFTFAHIHLQGTNGIVTPPEVLEVMLNTIGIEGNSTFANISCSKAVDLTFIISGKEFKVDPLDFIGGQSSDQHCNSSNLIPADLPSPGALFSWIIGDVFMKFYYGNLTFLSVDPPCIGFYSTVPSNASEIFSSAIAAALSTDPVSFISMLSRHR
jgi:hypothetical protein